MARCAPRPRSPRSVVTDSSPRQYKYPEGDHMLLCEFKNKAALIFFDEDLLAQVRAVGR